MIYENKTKILVSFVGLLSCLFVVSGCANHATEAKTECQNGICTSNNEYTAVCQETPDGYSICSEPVMPVVNYTQTAADFREYGERTPRDYRITQAGAGNNISAVVQPSIENEVVDYEAQVAAQQAANNQYQVANDYNPQGNQEINNINNSDNSNNNDSQEELTKDWLAEEGQSLKDLLTAWSEEAGWRLIWKTNRNYTLNAGAMFRGNFADVSSALVRAFARARPAPIATFYKGNRVLVIETMEDENAYD